MLIAKYDKALSFGALTIPSSAGTNALADVLKIDKADPTRRAVNFRMTTAGAGGTSATFLIQGSNDNSSYTTVASSPVIPVASLTENANFSVGIPQNFPYQYMRAAVTTVGTFSAGVVAAEMDVYQGA